MGKNSNDGILWKRITQNDEGAFSIVFDKYFIRLCNYCYPIVNKTEAAEEIVSEVFTKLWIKRHSIQIKVDLKSYLFRAVKNTALNFLRQVSDQVSLDDANVNELESFYVADSKLIDDEVNAKLEQILKSLSPQQSLVLRMYKLEGFSQAEIAEVLSVSKKTVQNHIYLAIKTLTEQRSKYRYEFYFAYILLTINILQI